jgi:serine/threonine protein kinase
MSSRKGGDGHRVRPGQLEVPDPVKTNSAPLAPSDHVRRAIPSPVAKIAPSDRQFGKGSELPTLPVGYQDFRLLGSGGFGDVLSARKSDGTLVAIKRLRQVAGDRDVREKWFRREVRLLSELKSPAVPRLLDHKLDIVHPYFVMEYIEGRTLSEWVSGNGPLSRLQLVQNLSIDTASALVEMHGKGFLHRDIKPSNVMLTDNGRFKVIDLGIGKDICSDSSSSHVNAGTLAFAAPELLTSRGGGPTADIFSWGATIGYAMTGLMPYGEVTGSELLMRVARGEIDRHFLDGVQRYGRQTGSDGSVLSRVVANAVRPDPNDRSRDAIRALGRPRSQAK